MKKIIILLILIGIGVTSYGQVTYNQSLKKIVDTLNVKASKNDLHDTLLQYLPQSSLETYGIKRIVGSDDVDVYVYDVNKNGELEELAAAIVAVRPYSYAYINVASGRYNLTAPIVITQDNYGDYIDGNGAILYLPYNYAGNAIEITSTGDFQSLKISDLTFRETNNGSEYGRLWNGLYVSLGTGQDLQMSYFTNLDFIHVGKAIYIVLTGSGWMNGNNFINTKATHPIIFMKVNRRAGNTGTYFDGNFFTNTQIQCGTVTTVGVDTLYGNHNIFRDFNYWDGPANTYAIKFDSKCIGNVITGGLIPYADYGNYPGNNFIQGSFVTSGNMRNRQNYLYVTKNAQIDGTLTVDTLDIASDKLAVAGTNESTFMIQGLNYATGEGSSGVKGYSYATSGSATTYGIYGQAAGTAGSATKIGVYGTASGGLINYAGYFLGDLKTTDDMAAKSITTTGADTASVTAVVGRIVYKTSDGHFYGCKSTTGKKWYQLDN